MIEEDQDNNHESEWANIEKSPLMVYTFLLFWGLSLVSYGPKLWQILTTSRTVIEAIILSGISIFYIIFWLLGAYFFATIVFYFFSRPSYIPAFPVGEKKPHVAILYTTCNDFSKEAALSCLNQNYPYFHIFLLDDSNKDEIRFEIDTFHAAHPDITTIVRRATRQGFKPGALNNALLGEAAEYPFFAVIDADEKLPRDFLWQTMAYMRDPKLSFVQANHAPTIQQNAIFAQDIGPTILPFWDVHCKVRNRYGFVMYMGHGVILRRSDWEKVGGFPEVITEDLAFSVLLAEKGMRGIFLENVLCHEDFPTTYLAFKKQHERYIIGTTQVLCKYLGRLLQSKGISSIEKIDFLLWCSPLYIPALCLVFVALSSLGLTIFFGEWSTLTIYISGNQFDIFPIRILDERFASLWSWDFQIFSIFVAFSPAFACIVLGLKKKLNATKLLFLSTTMYLSLMVLSWKGIIKSLSKDKICWAPTGERSPIYLKEGADKFVSVGSGTLCLLEICIGVILAIASLISFNIASFGVSSCILVGVYLEAFGWEGRFARFASSSCFVLILLQMIVNLVLRTHSTGLMPLVFSVHF